MFSLEKKKRLKKNLNVLYSSLKGDCYLRDRNPPPYNQYNEKKWPQAVPGQI